MDAFFFDKHVYTMMIVTKIFISIDRYKSMIIIIMHIYVCVSVSLHDISDYMGMMMMMMMVIMQLLN